MASPSSSETLALLRKTPLLWGLEEEDLGRLAERLEPLSLEVGQALCREGEEAQGLFLLVSGRARLVGKDQAGRELTLGFLEPGACFGEEALLSRLKSLQTVRASEEAMALRLAREAFQAFLEEKKDLREVLERLARAPVRNLLKQLSEKPIAARALREFLGLFEPESCKPGEVIFRAGEAGEKFYLVLSGKVLLTKPQAPEPKVLDLVREGGTLGAGALLSEKPMAATATTLEPTEVLSLTRKDFQKALGLSQELREDLPRLLARLAGAEPAPGAPLAPRYEPLAVESSLSLRRRRRRFPWVRQHDQTDCGAACLAMISKFYGVETTLGRLRDLVNVTREGTTMLAVAEGAQKLGYLTQGMLASRHYLEKFPLPAIAHWGGFHFVVVTAVRGEKVSVADPALGLREMSLSEFDKGWTGRILLLTPTDKIYAQEPVRGSLTRWLPLLKPYRALLAEIFLCSLVINILGLASPVFTQTIVDQVLVHASVPMLNLLLVGMLLVAFFQILTSALRQYLLVHMGLRIDQSLISQFFQHALSLPIRFFERRKVGDVTSRIEENEKIRSMITHLLPALILDVLMTLVYLSLMMIYNLKLTAVALAFFPLFAALTAVYTSVMKRVSQEIFLKRTESASYGIEAVAGIATLKSMAIETPALWKWNALFGRSVRSGFKGGMVELVSESAGGLLSTLSGTLLLWYGAHQVIKGELTVGQLMAFNVLVGSVFGPLTRLVNSWGEAQAVLIAIERLNDVFDSEPEENPRRHPLLPAPPLKGQVRFEGVFFRYHPSDKKGVLKNVSLELPEGKTAALVGRSGAGKTTLAKLILRLYLPSQGKILVDGHDLAALSPGGLRRQMGVVPQEAFLFSGTIRENIALGDGEVPFERVVEAARIAGAHDFVSEMPLGYDTPVGERGVALSGGQRQRVAIARAILRDPRILIFDEATSSLDTESERAIQKNIAGILKGRTTLMIAHRLSTVREADVIFVLDQGWLVESGSHRELMEKRGLYFHLVSQQLEA